MTTTEVESSATIVRHTGPMPALAGLVILVLGVLTVQLGLQASSPDWKPSSPRRLGFLVGWDPEVRAGCLLLLGIMFAVIGVSVFRVLAQDYRARLTTDGAEIVTLFGRTRLAWSAVTSVKTFWNGRQSSIGFSSDAPGSLLGQRTCWLPTRGLNRSHDDILALVAHHRPDLLPEVRPLDPNSIRPKPAPPQPPIIVDTRGWTGRG